MKHSDSLSSTAAILVGLLSLCAVACKSSSEKLKEEWEQEREARRARMEAMVRQRYPDAVELNHYHLPSRGKLTIHAQEHIAKFPEQVYWRRIWHDYDVLRRQDGVHFVLGELDDRLDLKVEESALAELLGKLGETGIDSETCVAFRLTAVRSTKIISPEVDGAYGDTVDEVIDNLEVYLYEGEGTLLVGQFLHVF